MVRNAPTFREVAQEVYALLEGQVFVAHNVKFDYRFLKARFQVNGIRYRTPHLCTVELSRKIFPGLPSYSLGNLCKSLDIPIVDRHRAYGDTKATATLFEKLMSTDKQTVLDSVKSDEVKSEFLPPSIDVEDVDTLSESRGVYTFYNKEGEYLYISKTKNIRESILSHFQTPYKLQAGALEKEIYSFSVLELPSEMLARLREAEDILLNRPVFNKKLRKINKKYGLFLEKDHNGYLNYKIIENSKTSQSPILKITSLSKGRKIIQKLRQKYPSDTVSKKTILSEKHNQIIKESVSKITYPFQNCWIIEQLPGQELSVVYIVKGYELRGYSIQDNIKYKDFKEVMADFHPIEETTDIRRKFLQFLHKGKSNISIIDLENSE